MKEEKSKCCGAGKMRYLDKTGFFENAPDFVCSKCGKPFIPENKSEENKHTDGICQACRPTPIEDWEERINFLRASGFEISPAIEQVIRREKEISYNKGGEDMLNALEKHIKSVTFNTNKE